jgi:hypothetical protein
MAGSLPAQIARVVSRDKIQESYYAPLDGVPAAVRRLDRTNVPAAAQRQHLEWLARAAPIAYISGVLRCGCSAFAARMDDRRTG